MKERIKRIVMSALVVMGLGFTLVPAAAGAVNVDPLGGTCQNVTQSTVCDKKDDNITTTITTVVSVLSFAVGIIAVIMIIVGGIFYSISVGDQSKITKAKYTIMYAVVGLIVSILAYAIVNFVINQF